MTTKTTNETTEQLNKINAIIDGLPKWNEFFTFADGTPFDDDLRAVAIIAPYLVRAIDGRLNDKDTQGGIAIICHNDKDERNLLVFMPNERPYFAFAYHNHAIVLTGEKGGKLAVVGIDNAIALFDNTKETVITLPSCLNYFFERACNAFLPRYAITTHDRPLKVKCPSISTIAPMETQLQGTDFDNIVNDGETVITDGNTDEWGELLPLTLDAQYRNPYPIHAFGKLADVVRTIAYFAQVPVSWVGQSVLGALSILAQERVNAPMNYSHKPTSLFLLTEGGSGGGKGNTKDLVYKAILEHDEMVYKKYQDEMEIWEYNARYLTGDERVQFFKENPQPIDTTRIVKDATVERILDRFIAKEAKNQAWITDEAGSFFGGYSMKSETRGNALSSYTDLWSNGTVNRQRLQNKERTKFSKAYDCRFTLDLSGQRVILSKAINDDLLRNQGFLPRFLICAEPSLVGYRNFDIPEVPDNQLILKEYWGRCKELLQTPNIPDRFNMPFANGSRATLQRYQNSIEVQMRVGGKYHNITAFASRMAENATKIATIMAFFNKESQVTDEYLNNAFALVEYSINELLHYNDQKGDMNRAEKLMEWLIANHKDGKLGKTMISQNAPFRGKELAELLDGLAEANYIRIEKGKGNSKFVVLNPYLNA